MRDDEVVDDLDKIQPAGGVGGPIIAGPDDGAETIAEQIPSEERDLQDEYLAPEDDALLDAGASPEFDHSLRRRKLPASE